MLKTYFREVQTGRLQRLSYFGHWILLIVVMIAIGIGTTIFIGVAGHIVGGDVKRAQAQLAEGFSLPTITLFALIMVFLLFASLNIQAKRFRDMGLPGWLTLLGLIVLGILLSLTVAENAGGIINAVMVLALIFVPSNAFRRKKTDA